ncbi:TraC family protein [Escherichia coli]
MNNPLEAVTQAVNSLVTALKLPDESAKANEVLGEMSFPQFSRLLPYRDYNQESGLFMNDTTMGFMLEAIPINGANESIVEALDHMLRTKLPRGIPLCIHLMSSQLVGDRIEYGLREFSWSGEQAERFNAITRAYYMKAAATQFPLPEGMNLPLTLRHYRVFISYCSPSKKKSRADILEMENLVKIIRASLQGASITTQTVDAQAFIDIVGEMINHIPEVVSGEDVTQAEQPQQPVSPAINDKKSDSGVNVPAGGIEQELKMKPEEEMEQQLPPGISESGEVVDMAAYEAWKQENHPDIQQQMQRREEVNINVHRERGEDVEPGDDF